MSDRCQQHTMYDPTCPQCQWGTKANELCSLASATCYAALAKKVEDYAALRAYNAGMGAGEWEAFLTPSETELLTKLAAIGYGTWANEKRHNGPS